MAELDARIRRARPEDDEALAALVYASATLMYDAVAGSRGRALRTIRVCLSRPETGKSREVARVAELDGAAAGALFAFPAAEGSARARAELRAVLRTTPPWRWPRILRLEREASRELPAAPATALWIEALATAAAHRRRGLARALLRDAERRAREAGLSPLALDTSDRNTAALALYESEGFRVAERVETRSHPAAALLLLKDLT